MQQADCLTDIPYGRSIYLSLKDEHFSYLRKISDCRDGEQWKDHRDIIDWFEMDCANEEETVQKVEHTQDICSDKSKSQRTKETKKIAKKPNNKWEMKSSMRPSETYSQSDRPEPSVIESSCKVRDKDTVVTNLSSYKLTAAQEDLLSKGLKFIPDRTKIDKIKLLADLKEWERRMRLREYFYDREKAEDEEGEEDPQERFTVKKKSTFTPAKGRNLWLDMYIELVKTDIVNNLKKAKKLNLTAEEHDAFLSLVHNDNIIIRPADKGSGIAVMDKSEYMERIRKEMEGSKSYMETEGDQTEVAWKKVKKLVNRMHRDGVITKDMKQYLTFVNPKAGSLKGNPKLHKSGAPFRTIVSGINTPTEKMAEVAEYELQEYVLGSPSYIRDTTDFINKLQEIDEPIPEGAFLFCFDVCKLYPSVPKEEGIAACREALETRTAPLILTEYVLEMIKTVLENNTFKFGDHNYKQTEGIAIGSRLGRKFACSYMRKWDEELIKYDRPMFYKRYIDDGFGIWTGSLQSLQEFARYANNIHSSIQIELRYSQEKIEFLDTWVKLENGRSTQICTRSHLINNFTSKKVPATLLIPRLG